MPASIPAPPFSEILNPRGSRVAHRARKPLRYRETVNMLEVTSLKHASLAVEEFKSAYAVRYGHSPALDKEIELQLFLKNLVKKFTYERVLDLIRFFFKNNGDKDWWRRRGHSAKTFQFEIEAIIAAYATANPANRTARPQNQTEGLLVTFETQCNSCKCWHFITCQGNEMGKHAYLTRCKECNQIAGSEL